jgi:L-aminopeptidase/D-esterase-like protein
MPAVNPHLSTPAGRPRARSLQIPFTGTPGPSNAITDVPGLEVGICTRIEGDRVRTGVTAIHPRGKGNPGDPCAAATFSLNGNGEMTGVTWIEESGTLALPIAITNTHAVGIAQEAIIHWVVSRHPSLADIWMLPVSAETWDGYLNDINGGHVTREHVLQALDSATTGPIEEGSVGGGTGMNCYSFKGGNGTASRTVAWGSQTYTVGTLLQCNFGARNELSIGGVPLGAALADDDPLNDWFAGGQVGAGSVIAIVATDAPLLPGQCKALARRVPLGLARTGTTGSHFSGDIFLAFSTANPGVFRTGFPAGEPGDDDHDTMQFVPWQRMDHLYAAVVECVEESVVNALVANEEMVGLKGHRTPGLPRDRVRELLAARGALTP